MPTINNSLSTFLQQAMILEKNSLETVSKIKDAVISNDDIVTLTLTDPSDPSKIKEYNIPSFSYLKSEIDRLNNTINTVTNISNSAASTIKLSDGTYRKIIASKVPTEAPTITSVNNITNFNFKSNWFFEDFLNPALYITWDMSNQITSDTDRVMVRRYILKCETQSKIRAFDSIKGRNDINHNDFLNFIVNNKIRYNVDEDIRNLPPRSRRFYGDFSVVRISDVKIGNKLVKRYYLSSMEYSDTRSDMKNTRILSVGDIVEVVKRDAKNNKIVVSTRYKVDYSSPTESCIGLTCIEGSDNVRIGVGVLRMSAVQDNIVSVDINVGFDEREVIFVKPIDPDSNIPASEWSPGVSFYTNELTYIDTTGATQTLQKFYQKNVVDFGQILLSYSNDYYPSIREGLIPNKPVLNYSSNGGGDFKIVQINNQLREGADAESLRKLVSDKIRIQSEIDNIGKQILNQRVLLQTTNYITNDDKLKEQSSLNSLIANQSMLISNYNSIIGAIKSKYESTDNVSPKYRVRGFWDIPDSVYSTSSGEQKIIMFKIRYRYLSKSGNTNREDEFSYTSNGQQVVGRFSNWNEIETKRRERVQISGSWEWEDIDTSNPDIININQLDIPIQRGEQVEIQVRSVSEAGWPSNPLMSDWSDSIIVSFSDFSELESNDIDDIISQNRIDSSLSMISTAMSSANEHISTSFFTNDKYFAHSADNITSGFLSPEQTPITLYDKLRDLQRQIDKINSDILKIKGELVVTLIDPNGSSNKYYNLKNGTTTYVYGGNYVSDINDINDDEKNGAIVTKTFYLDIKSNINSGLYLISRLHGNRASMCPSTIDGGDKDVNHYLNIIDDNKELNQGIVRCNMYSLYDNVKNISKISSNYYYEMGRYDLVPINLSQPVSINFQTTSPNMYQSAQCNGQFVYSRFRDITDSFDLYTNSNEGFKTSSNFEDSEVYYDINKKYYGDGIDAKEYLMSVVDDYNSMTASDISVNEFDEEGHENYFYDSYVDNFKFILNRLPKNWDFSEEFIQQPYMGIEKKLSKRITKNNKEDIDKQIRDAVKMAGRIENLSYNNKDYIYFIKPKIQSTYGFGDLGNIKGTGIFSFVGENNDNKIVDTTEDTNYTYLTTHKIGYENKDRYAVGKDTCGSVLFLSPTYHENIQVDGDNMDSKRFIDDDQNTIRVPIVYQYRMTDYNGNIFGEDELESTSIKVKNTKYANIIGLDIWTIDDESKPKQFDLIVYSTYDNSIDLNSGVSEIFSQSLVNAASSITTSLKGMLQQSISTNVKK